MPNRVPWLADPAAYLYRPGSLFLGLAQGQEVGVLTERHAVTVAGARSGKGACLLIPNALRWSESLLVVDPKGENAEATWQARQALGQQVAVLDPFRVADVPDDLRARFNPLAALDASSLTAREDIRVIADGLVKRHNDKDGEWYDGAVSILAGVIAFAVEQAPPEHRTFAAVRAVLLQPDQVTDDAGNLVGGLYFDAQRMAQSSAFGGLVRTAGIALQTAITTEKSMERSFLSNARRATDWMDSPPMADLMASSSVKLSDLKAGNLSLYLVLPPKYIEEHSTFLRLFVRLAIEAMMQEGVKGSGRCLMLLDEFYSLGRLDIVSKSAGLMPGYGLHLWPFLQDIGQLRALYGDHMADTFFSNSDAAIFFGNADMPTLDYVSRRVGNLTVADLPRFDVEHPGYGPGVRQEIYREMKGYYTSMISQHIGRPRLAPEEVARLTGKGPGDKVARAMLAFVKAGAVLHLRLAPYFEDRPREDASGQPVAAADPSPVLQRIGRKLVSTLPRLAAGFALALALVLAGWLVLGQGAALTVQTVAFFAFLSFAFVTVRRALNA